MMRLNLWWCLAVENRLIGNVNLICRDHHNRQPTVHRDLLKSERLLTKQFSSTRLGFLRILTEILLPTELCGYSE